MTNRKMNQVNKHQQTIDIWIVSKAEIREKYKKYNMVIPVIMPTKKIKYFHGNSAIRLCVIYINQTCERNTIQDTSNTIKIYCIINDNFHL